jgi:hypothetical protein
MDSHQYAELLKQRAEYLLNKDAFELPTYTSEKESFWYMWESDKPKFLDGVRALGAGEKKTSDEYVEFWPYNAPVRLKINRSVVCKLVKPAEYDCVPLLSQIEEAELEGKNVKTK